MSQDRPNPLLQIRDLDVSFRTEDEVVNAVRDVSLQVGRSEFVGLVGESGSGKSVTARTVLGLNPSNAITSGAIEFDGIDLTTLADNDFRTIRGSQISMIFQNPMSGLNPVLSIGRQMKDSLKAHPTPLDGSARNRAAELLDIVGLPQPERTLSSYPHELSGGMQQRVMIAMAIAHNPRLLIADEPTTALDVTIQAQVMEVLEDVRAKTGTAILLITHDLGLVAGMADRVYVMFNGEIYESGTANDIFYAARSPYTQMVLGSQPHLLDLTDTGSSKSTHTETIDAVGAGCSFVERCEHSIPDCSVTKPNLIPITATGHAARCLRLDEIPPYDGHILTSNHERSPVASVPDHKGPALLEVRSLVTSFSRRRGFQKIRIDAVDNVSLHLEAGETLGVVGESGSGKTTLGRTITRLIDSDDGDIHLEGESITNTSGADLRALRKHLQIVFQDPYGSLNPRMTARQAIREPLLLWSHPDTDIAARVEDLAHKVGLPASLLGRRPSQLSGGQMQRVGIARALAMEAKVVVLDEPVSALDLSVQAEILRLLVQLQEELSLSYLFITHDLSVARFIADRVAVMYSGKIVETGPTDQIFDAPGHPYTKALISAVPIADPRSERSRKRMVLGGELPNPAAPPSGCRFRTRCPLAESVCADIEPPLNLDPSSGRAIACHFPLVDHKTEEEIQEPESDQKETTK